MLQLVNHGRINFVGNAPLNRMFYPKTNRMFCSKTQQVTAEIFFHKRSDFYSNFTLKSYQYYVVNFPEENTRFMRKSGNEQEWSSVNVQQLKDAGINDNVDPIHSKEIPYKDFENLRLALQEQEDSIKRREEALAAYESSKEKYQLKSDELNFLFDSVVYRDTDPKNFSSYMGLGDDIDEIGEALLHAYLGRSESSSQITKKISQMTVDVFFIRDATVVGSSYRNKEYDLIRFEGGIRLFRERGENERCKVVCEDDKLFESKKCKVSKKRVPIIKEEGDELLYSTARQKISKINHEKANIAYRLSQEKCQLIRDKLNYLFGNLIHEPQDSVETIDLLKGKIL